jgi:REP element-mobilizing transposase RayT
MRLKHHGYQPAHVTLRLVAGLPGIRKRGLRLRDAVAKAHKERFRICEISIQRNHIHLIVEADDNVALSRGVQGFAVRVARRVNRFLSRSGRVFAERYHVRALRTPRVVRNALVYVLFNRKHHGQPGWELDPFSSARWFDGFADREPDHSASPMAPPRTWLLSGGWRPLGLIHLWECPAA